ncbi:LysR family transcriptional regulator [Bradyrhizobium mercantei]|uniref:LysR family transcriptional regulator n=1 Tax=Bradyrhizobium mercantei TaxID=1904807 RepID=UPI000975CEF7|nr:LysR family transcriptional regulator [Bradyrhizobium mercantei]
MDLRQIKCFVAVVEEGSVTGAARRLNVVQPAVSMSLRKLEDEFGVVLFDRSARGVVVSQKARGLYEICLQILDHVAAASEVLRSKDIEVPTKLAVGSLPSGGYSFIPTALNEVVGLFPNCCITSRQSFNEELLDGVAQGRIDIAVVSKIRKHERLPHAYLGSERLLCVSASDSGISGMEAISAAELMKRRLVLSPVLRRRFEDDFARAGLELSPALEVDDASLIFGVLRQPGWFSIMPASAFCGMKSGEFSVVPICEPTIERDRWIVWSSDKPLSSAAKAFDAAIRRLFTESRFVRLSSVTEPLLRQALPTVGSLRSADMPRKAAYKAKRASSVVSANDAG